MKTVFPGLVWLVNIRVLDYGDYNVCNLECDLLKTVFPGLVWLVNIWVLTVTAGSGCPQYGEVIRLAVVCSII